MSEINVDLNGPSYIRRINDAHNAGCAPYFCPTSGEVECTEHGGFGVCCDAPERHRPIPAPVPPAALEAAIEEAWRIAACYGELIPDEAQRAMSISGLDPHMALNRALIGTVVHRIAPILLAAGRSAAAADIRQKIDAWRPQANTSLYALDVLSYAAEIAEGNDHA